MKQKLFVFSVIVVMSLGLGLTAPTSGDLRDTPIVNEFVIAHTGVDDHEYVEVSGTASTDYSSLSILVVEGDLGSGPGVVDQVFQVGTTDGAGLWHTGFLSTNTLEGDTPESMTILLVEGFSGIVGDDLDTNDDAVVDAPPPWTTLHDDLSVDDGGTGDLFYSTTILTPDMDSVGFSVGGASRIPNGTDTDQLSDWMRNDWHQAGIPGETGSPVYGEAYNTPGEVNEAVPPQPLPTLVVNEIVIDHVGGNDDHQYIEVSGGAAMDYGAYTVVVLDGDSGEAGDVDQVYPVGTANGEGYWTTGFLIGGEILDQGACTVLLVTGFSGSEGVDLDVGDDGTLDDTPWTEIHDSVFIGDGDPGDVAYSTVVIDSGFDDIGTAPGGVSRVPDSIDTDSVTDWMRNDFDGEGLPGFSGTIMPGEAYNTPGALNRITVTDFYAGVSTANSAAMRSTLHETVDDHKFFPYSDSLGNAATDTWNILEESQIDPSNASNAVDTYKNETFTATGGYDGNHDREHSWPKALGVGYDDEDYQHTDCHHLFLTYQPYNSARSNYPFGDCAGGCSSYDTDAYNGVGGGGDSNFLGVGQAGSTVWQVWSHRKGDIARAVLYMDVRYEGGAHGLTGRTEPDLIVTDSASDIAGGTYYMGFLAELLDWHMEDPVDAEELAVNEVVYSYQGNRNPFVDHPEWVECVFLGANCGSLFSDGFEDGTMNAWSAAVP